MAPGPASGTSSGGSRWLARTPHHHRGVVGEVAVDLVTFTLEELRRRGAQSGFLDDPAQRPVTEAAPLQGHSAGPVHPLSRMAADAILTRPPPV